MSSRYGPGSSRKQSSRRTRENDVPMAYRELLRDTLAGSPPASSTPGTATSKRRRVGERPAPSHPPTSLTESHRENEPVPALPATLKAPDEDVNIESIDYTNSGESDIDWEDVDLFHAVQTRVGKAASHNEEESKSLDLDLTRPSSSLTVKIKRTIITAAEKKFRFEVHKLHILCLLAHVAIRNNWINDEDARKVLRRMLKKSTWQKLQPTSPTMLQYERSRTFLEGVREARDKIAASFTITKQGLVSATWEPTLYASDFEALDGPIPDKESFIEAAKGHSGSRDLCTQLFCGILRAAGVPTRLICSLQPLPFNFESIKPQSKSSSMKSQSTTVNPSVGSQPDGRGLHPESSYPIYWIEVWNVAVQKWTALDVFEEGDIKANSYRFEPPLSDASNNMSYVMAFEADGSARDVTRRYAKTMNSRTKKSRVDNTPQGRLWWHKALHIFRRKLPLEEDINGIEDFELSLARDDLENIELQQKELAEAMPASITAFRGHSLYVLERHLRRDEVIHPKVKVGIVQAGKDGSENVYRRNDVKLVRSAMNWYRRGREVKEGEQPLKHSRPSKAKQTQSGEADEAIASENTALYTESQTTLYKAPPSRRGRVPKNEFGNIDMFVPSMIPKGAIHLHGPLAMQAAKTLGIDFAPAVVSFEYRGRQAAPVFDGVVIALEYKEAAEAVIEGIADGLQDEDEMKQQYFSLLLWKRFLLGLRIRQQISSYDFEETSTWNNAATLADGPSVAEEQTTAANANIIEILADAGDMAGGFFADGMDEPGGFFAESENKPHSPTKVEDYKDEEEVEYEYYEDDDLLGEEGLFESG